MKNDLKIAIVAPAHIELTDEWIKSLQHVSKNHTVIIVDDSDGKISLPSEWDVYGYDRQKEELGDDLYEKFKIFHKSSSCRNFGHWIAFKQGFDVIIALDSDCIVPPNFISDHLESIMGIGYGWENPIKQTGWFPRGFPYYERIREIVLNLGLWNNELDVNGMDRVKNGQPPRDYEVKKELAHAMIPLCGMNFAVWARAIPAFLFIPNFDDGDDKIRRYDDIWGGYIFQKIMQRHNQMISYGTPVVYHDTIIDPLDDAREEEGGIKWEESFYKMVDIVMNKVETDTYEKMFAQFVDIATEMFEDTPFKNLIPGLQFWKEAYESIRK